MSVALTITKLSKAQTRRKMLVTGLSGAGKTHLCRQLVEAGYGVLLASTENKLETLAGLEDSPLLDVVTISSYQFPRTESEEKAFGNSLDTAGDLFNLCALLKKGEHSYDVLFVDSGMLLCREAMRHYTSTTYNEKQVLDTRGGYGEFGHRMIRFFEKLLSYSNPAITPRPVHVIVTWGVERTDNGNEKRQLGPIVDGNMVGPDLPYKFSDVIYLHAKDENGVPVRYAGLQQTDSYYAKCETGAVALPPLVRDFNVVRFLQLLGAAPPVAAEVVK